jgi:hypothetical protein
MPQGGGFGRRTDPVADVVARLRAHGVRTVALEAPRSFEVERFRITGQDVAEREFQGHRERTITGEWQAAEPVELPAGTILVEMNQPLARLAFHLLEPEADDGFAAWGLLDAVLEGATAYPVLRVR